MAFACSSRADELFKTGGSNFPAREKVS